MDDRGPAFLAAAWLLTVIMWIVLSIRLYSRTFLTGSVGSDDFAIGIAAGLTSFGAAINSIQVHARLGHHQSDLTSTQYSLDQEWEYIGWLEAFICYFFTRTSVMLFVLRLLPAYKKWQHRVIYLAFFFNFAITVVATVSYGVACIPFSALWSSEPVPGARCFSKDLLVITARFNGILACVIDLVTALVPALLLWNVKMRRKTKLALDFIFLLGLATAALSIGRVVTITKSAMEEDSTYRLIPAKYFGMMEEKFGVITACGPALRQFFAYRVRTGTFLPDPDLRQSPNEDFVKMRQRINLRDIFWYRKAASTGGRVLDARPIFQGKGSALPLSSKKGKKGESPSPAPKRGELVLTHTPPSPPPPKTEEDGVAPEAQRSILDSWQWRVKRLFGVTGGTPTTAGSNDNREPVPKTPASEGWLRRKMFALPFFLSSQHSSSSSPKRASSDHEKLAGAGASPAEDRSDSGDSNLSGSDMTASRQEGRRIARNYKTWGLFPKRGGGEKGGEQSEGATSLATQAPFLQSASGGGDTVDIPSSDGDRDEGLVEVLANPAGNNGHRA